MEVHCYLAWDAAPREAALFEPVERQPILALLQENGLGLKHLFITHTHHDHIAALSPIRASFRKSNCTPARPTPGQQRNQPAKSRTGSLQVPSRKPPGHADDGVT
ncbi:MAG: hypothetical protein CM1200mP29_14460 [Verrucomicrobiota bacterium]|nr:MAG: hypothetical protein CM1200mP29_14460 [Verrucomicrobiota bacterium]